MKDYPGDGWATVDNCRSCGRLCLGWLTGPAMCCLQCVAPWRLERIDDKN